MFETSLVLMAKAVEDFEGVPRQLNGCIEELSQVADALGRLSYMEEPLRNIRRTECRMEVSFAQTAQLQTALEAICRQYGCCEQGILDYSGKIS